MIGGFLALAGAIVVGPRKGFREGEDLKGHNMPYVVIGTFILFFGWFGFNINSDSLGLNAVNTLLAGAAGAVSAIYIAMIRTGKADIEMGANGALAGLVGITAGCAYVDPWAAVVIGLLAGIIMIAGVHLIKLVLKVDDPVGAITVHGICGAWGLLAVGIFASGNNGVEGLIAGNVEQLLPQIVGLLVAIAWGSRRGLHPLQGHRHDHGPARHRRRGDARPRHPRARQVRIPGNVAPHQNSSPSPVLGEGWGEGHTGPPIIRPRVTYL